jgi:hypothetical protein
MGRLFVICPDCGTPINPDGMADRNELVCPQCHKDAYKMGLAPTQRPDGSVLWDSIPDYWTRNETIKQLRANGKVYPITYPDNLDKIFAVLRKRPGINQNMNPGETLADLVKENAAYGIKEA